MYEFPIDPTIESEMFGHKVGCVMGDSKLCAHCEDRCKLKLRDLINCSRRFLLSFPLSVPDLIALVNRAGRAVACVRSTDFGVDYCCPGPALMLSPIHLIMVADAPTLAPSIRSRIPLCSVQCEQQAARRYSGVPPKRRFIRLLAYIQYEPAPL